MILGYPDPIQTSDHFGGSEFCYSSKPSTILESSFLTTKSNTVCTFKRNSPQQLRWALGGVFFSIRTKQLVFFSEASRVHRRKVQSEQKS